MKILNVCGSSIDGSSATIANRFLEKAGRLGAEIQSFKLEGGHNTRCKECMSCKTTTDRCVIHDDTTAAIREKAVIHSDPRRCQLLAC